MEKINQKIKWKFFSRIISQFISNNALVFYLGTIKVNMNICTECGICENLCTSYAIKLDPYPKIIKKKCF